MEKSRNGFSFVFFLPILLILANFMVDISSAEVAVQDQDVDIGSKQEEGVIPKRRVLVLGGNGMLGSAVVERLIRDGYNITIVNRGNWYWDSKVRIAPYVRTVSCDRTKNVTSCQLLAAIIKQMRDSNERFSAVLDFSARGGVDITDTMSLLSDTTELYVFISSDAVYDVSDSQLHQDQDRSGYGHLEEDAVRPSDQATMDILAQHYQLGHRKMECEEALIRQRYDESGFHVPYVILRLPDVIGSRDTTYRFWIYQLWIRLTEVLNEYPVTIPHFLKDYNNSFVYAEDVAVLITDRILDPQYRREILDQVFNVAWPINITLEQLLREIARELRVDEELNLKIINETGTVYLYPTARRGQINPSKIMQKIGWRPTDWKDAVRQTIAFYEQAMRGSDFETQRNEIVQMIKGYVYHDNATDLYGALEKLYGIDLSHFKPREEL